VQTISYAGGSGFRVPAYLVLPRGEGPYPALIYLHKGAGNKNQFLAEAITLADMNVASLLLDSPFVPKLDGEDEVRADYPGTTREGMIRQVLDIRRGVDLLETIPEIDASRIGYVGHSHGATHGGIVTGIETRIKTYVLVAGSAQISAMQSSALSPPGMLAAAFDPDLDAIHYVGHGSPAAMLFQFAELDHHIDRGQARLFFSAASEPKTILWYTADHDSIEWKGRRDRLQWLGDQLAFAYEPED
jgi:dienelactone hydrolase